MAFIDITYHISDPCHRHHLCKRCRDHPAVRAGTPDPAREIHRAHEPGVPLDRPVRERRDKLDLRTQVVDVPSQEVITKDNSPTNVAIVYVRVIDPEKAYFEVSNYRMATVALAQQLRGIIGDMELDEVSTTARSSTQNSGTSLTARPTSGA